MKRDQLEMHGRRIEARVIVRKKVARLGGGFLEQRVERRCVDGHRHFVALAAPNPGIGVPAGEDREDHRLHARSLF